MSEEPTHKKVRTSTPIPTQVLSQINKSVLDFELDQKCSVSLARNNVYCCLACGKFLAGRSPTSPMAKHVLLLGHVLFIHLQLRKYYIMPENIEVDDPHSLDLVKDITRAVQPTFQPSDSYNVLTTSKSAATDWNQKPYLPGYVSLLPQSLLLSVLIQVLIHTPELVDFFLFNDKLSSDDTPLTSAFIRVLCRVWSCHLPRPLVSLFPIEKILGLPALPKQALLTLINKIHAESKATRLLISQAFRGKILTSTDGEKAVVQKFWMLNVNVPPKPLFGTGQKVPQVALTSLLEKYDGQSILHTKYIIQTLPRNLIILLDRGPTHNPTVVSIPDTLDMALFTCDQKSATYSLLAVISRTPNKNWQVSLPRGDDWFTLGGNTIVPTQKEVLFMEEIHLMVWRRIDK